jgi:ring-1,2-phenylacetyl-CoA epoxidase subunit PaaC
MFIAADYEKENNIDFALLKTEWLQKITTVFDEATLPIPENTFMQMGGKEGVHTEHLGFILTELQYLQRAYPNSQW